MRLNFRFHQCPRFRVLFACSTFIVEWWRTPGNGHTDALRHEINARDDELHAERTRTDQLPPAKGRSMAVKGRIVAQSGQSQQSGVSHRCHLLSRDLGKLLAGIWPAHLNRARTASAMPLLRVYAIHEWIVKGNLPVFLTNSPVLFT